MPSAAAANVFKHFKEVFKNTPSKGSHQTFTLSYGEYEEFVKMMKKETLPWHVRKDDEGGKITFYVSANGDSAAYAYFWYNKTTGKITIMFAPDESEFTRSCARCGGLVVH